MPLGITEPEALVMITILAKVVFHTGVEALFCINNELKSLNGTSLKRRPESAYILRSNKSKKNLEIMVGSLVFKESKGPTSKARPRFIQKGKKLPQKLILAQSTTRMRYYNIREGLKLRLIDD